MVLKYESELLPIDKNCDLLGYPRSKCWILNLGDKIIDVCHATDVSSSPRNDCSQHYRRAMTVVIDFPGRSIFRTADVRGQLAMDIVGGRSYPCGMCGRFVMKSSPEETGRFFETEIEGEGLPLPSWNISPTQTICVVVESAKGETAPVRRLEPARWSLVPSWSKELKLKYPTFNARTEDIMSKATWKPSVRSKRALIPASGYFEWKTAPDGEKTPYFIRPKGDELLAFAGLYSWFADPAKEKDDSSRWLLTATILTSPAVPHLAGIHDRNPVPLPRELFSWWLDPETEGDQSMVDAAVDAAIPIAEKLRLHRVPQIRGNGPELIAET